MQATPVVGILLLLLIGFLWIGVVANVASPNSSDAAGNGMASAFLALFAIVMWVLLAILLTMAAVKGDMPGWTKVAAFILVPASGVAAVMAGELIAELDKLGSSGKWLIAVPALAPPFMVFFALWVYWPSLHASVPSGI